MIIVLAGFLDTGADNPRVLGLFSLDKYFKEMFFSVVIRIIVINGKKVRLTWGLIKTFMSYKFNMKHMSGL